MTDVTAAVLTLTGVKAGCRYQSKLNRHDNCVNYRRLLLLLIMWQRYQGEPSQRLKLHSTQITEIFEAVYEEFIFKSCNCFSDT